MKNNEKILCDTCIANSVHSHCHSDGKGKCLACSRYYHDPKNKIGYVKYYYRKFKNRLVGFKYGIQEKFNWWKFNTLSNGIPSCVSHGDIIEVLDTETGNIEKYKVNSAWVVYDKNKPGFELMSSVSTLDNPRGWSISTMDTNLCLNFSGKKYHVVSINNDKKFM